MEAIGEHRRIEVVLSMDYPSALQCHPATDTVLCLVGSFEFPLQLHKVIKKVRYSSPK